MDIRKVTNEYRLKNWTELISECNRSGLKVKDWCKENNINKASYYYWLKRVRIAAYESMSDVSNRSQQIVPIKISNLSQNVLTETTESSQAAIILKMNSVVIEIRNGASDCVIENTLKVVSKLC